MKVVMVIMVMMMMNLIMVGAGYWDARSLTWYWIWWRWRWLWACDGDGNMVLRFTLRQFCHLYCHYLTSPPLVWVLMKPLSRRRSDTRGVVGWRRVWMMRGAWNLDDMGDSVIRDIANNMYILSFSPFLQINRLKLYISTTITTSQSIIMIFTWGIFVESTEGSVWRSCLCRQ